jgi:EAL domain-containing protein (putative c-di-GMP-specific phosphodiesterase class I)
VSETEPSWLLTAADKALHWAIADGKGLCRMFETERDARDLARYKLSAAMPGALERGEFRLEYQPLVDLATGELAGVEALARWVHPELGVITPDRFIDLAEDTGLIVPLGTRLLEQACRQAARWQAIAARPPFVSVNLAVRQIRDPELVAHIVEVLDRAGLPPRLLQLEITESAAMGTDDATVDTLHTLAGLGIRLAIDDFGTGYANLSYLRHLPVQALKIPSTFVRCLDPHERNPLDEAILTTLVSIGHTLGLDVTAEGVETAAQAAWLSAVGCDHGQGWYLGRPVPPEELAF